MVRGVAFCLLSLALLASPAYAEKPAHAGKPKQPKGSHAGRGDGYGFQAYDRDQFRDWYVDQYGRGHCPPGLAKKHNGCLPPGQAKKRYAIGYPLPPGVVLAPLPAALAAILGAAPRGYRYGWIDGDVVKLAIGTALVVDALQGLSD